MALTNKQQRFADLLLSGVGPSEAYRRSYESRNMPSTSISVKAAECQKGAAVSAYLAEQRAALSRTALMTAADVLNEWITIATADPQELVRTRVRACRHCHGLGHAYQWRSEQEWQQACIKALEWRPPRKDPEAEPPPMPDAAGGFGFHVDLSPMPDCPQCDGDGQVDHIIADTRTLSPAGRKLYAGVKVTKDGIQVLMRDQDAALANVAKYLGMMVDKREVTGANGGPVVMQVSPLDEDL